MAFSVEGSDADKAALMQVAIQQFHLRLGSDMAGRIADVLRFGRTHGATFGGGHIVGDESNGILTVGGKASTHYVLPGDYGKALEGIGKFFRKI